MSSPRLHLSQHAVPLHPLMFGGGLFLLFSVLVLTVLLAADLGDALTRNTVRLALAWYAVALVGMMQLGARDWQAATPLGSFTRWCWTWGIVVFGVHLAMAFHYFHHWSHGSAFERTREVSGAGEGVYVSYLFTLTWIADAVFWWLFPSQYAKRSAMIDRTLHLFMLFIVFNGMVVFETGFIRWAGVAMFLVLAVCWQFLRQPSTASPA